jgi:hypothetical protein
MSAASAGACSSAGAAPPAPRPSAAWPAPPDALDADAASLLALSARLADARTALVAQQALATTQQMHIARLEAQNRLLRACFEEAEAAAARGGGRAGAERSERGDARGAGAAQAPRAYVRLAEECGELAAALGARDAAEAGLPGGDADAAAAAAGAGLTPAARELLTLLRAAVAQLAEARAAGARLRSELTALPGRRARKRGGDEG